MTEVLKHLASLKTGQWHNLNDIPKPLFDDAWKIIDEELLDGYRFTLHEVYNYLVMKTKRTEKEQLLSSLAELERGIGTVDWIYISTPETGYIVSIQKDGKIRNMDNPDIHKIFIPKTNIQDYFEWIYKHAKTIKIRYLDE